MFENDLKKGIDAMTNNPESKPDLSETYRGIEGTRYAQRNGNMATPIIEYKDQTFDYNDVEDALWDTYKEQMAEKGLEPNKNEFDDWVNKNKHIALGELDNMYNANVESQTQIESPKYKTADEVGNAWQQLFKEWDEKYPDNKSWNSIKANKVWEEEGWKKRSDDLEKEFDRLATKEWNKEHPEWYFNKETQKYEKVDPESREWNEELGEYQLKEEPLETRNARMTLYSQKLDDALKERDRILKADNVPNKADQLNDINDVIDFYKRKLANKE